MKNDKRNNTFYFEAVATCGHPDTLGYLAGTTCGKCAKRNHRKATRGRR
jgi:hypothetical protein